MAKLGIDATNLNDGGGLTYLLELIGHAEPKEYGFEEVVVWGGESLDQVADQSWLTKKPVVANRSYLQRTSWASRRLGPAFLQTGCSLLFAPAGTFASKTIPYVSMSQNMLLYDDDERRRFPWGWNRCRNNLLRHAQRRSFWWSVGNVFLSRYALNNIGERWPFVRHKPNTIIYHGVNRRFFASHQRNIKPAEPLRLLYVSRINYYKHQWNVVEAVKRLLAKGYQIQLRLVGALSSGLGNRMEQAMSGVAGDSVILTGNIPYQQIEQEYLAADVFVFASTCENMPNILVEAMAAGLPVVCSQFGPMPEILGSNGLYIDPTNIDSITDVLEQVIVNKELRNKLAQCSVSRARQFCWQQTASETFSFLEQCLSQSQLGQVVGGAE